MRILSQNFAAALAVTVALALSASGCKQTPYKEPEADRVFDVRIAIGYKDARPARFVSDRYERATLVHSLLKPCAVSANLACGFARHPQDGDLLLKTFTTNAGAKAKVRLRITASSAGADDDENKRDPYQEPLSKFAEANFLGGIAEADAVFYIGHSRDGGGPDFAPPRLNEYKHVDYDWYKQEKIGLGKLRKALREVNSSLPGGLRVLGLMSCASTLHFAKKLHADAPKLELKTMKELVYYAAALSETLSAVHSFLKNVNEADY